MKDGFKINLNSVIFIILAMALLFDVLNGFFRFYFDKLGISFLIFLPYYRIV